jgi:protein-tyrosine phosphatase
VIDLHCHVLPGIDDGPRTVEGSLTLARAAADAGTQTLVATPHVSWRYRNEAAAIASLTAELSARIAAEGLALELRRGAEIAISRLGDIEPAELGRLGLGDGPWLLMEPPFTPVAGSLGALLLELQREGHRILLAHPERCPAFHRDPSVLASLVRGGVLTSITAGSLVGRFGAPVRRFALELAREGMIHNVASDAHDAVHRPPAIAAELEQAGLGPLTEWLTCEVPAAILAGEDLPPRPALELPDLKLGRRPRWWRRGSG